VEHKVPWSEVAGVLHGGDSRMEPAHGAQRQCKIAWIPTSHTRRKPGRVTCFQSGQQSAKFPNALLNLMYGGDHHDASCPKAGSENNLGNFAPRIGFAHRLTQDGKTSLRGGLGYYYIPIETSQFNLFVDMAPFSPQFIFYPVDFTDPYASAGVPNPFPGQYGLRIRAGRDLYPADVSMASSRRTFTYRR